MRAPVTFQRCYFLLAGFLLLNFASSINPAFSDNLNNPQLIFSFTRSSSLQPRTIDTPDIRLYSDLTAIIHRPIGYKDPGEHRLQLSQQTFSALMQMLSETVAESSDSSHLQTDALKSINPNLQDIVIRSDPSMSTIHFTEAAAEHLNPALSRSSSSLINAAAAEVSSPNETLTEDALTEDTLTSISVSSPLHNKLLQLYKDLSDVSLNNEDR